jgi:hypothetical protein
MRCDTHPFQRKVSLAPGCSVLGRLTDRAAHFCALPTVSINALLRRRRTLGCVQVWTLNTVPTKHKEPTSCAAFIALAFSACQSQYDPDAC